MDQSRTCTVGDCRKRHMAHGYCAMHYMRWRRHGDASVRARRPNGEGIGRYSKPNGYVALKQPMHPLASATSGLVYEHRAVLFGLLGPGSHLCHHCGRRVSWASHGPDALQVDHLNGDKVDNRPSNLVPSCPACNSRRIDQAARSRNLRATNAARRARLSTRAVG